MRRESLSAIRSGSGMLLCGHFTTASTSATSADGVRSGDFVLTGGELRRLTVINGVSLRLLPGTLVPACFPGSRKAHTSLLRSTPHYPQPASFRGLERAPRCSRSVRPRGTAPLPVGRASSSSNAYPGSARPWI